MSKKKLRTSWRKGDMGLGQIAAVLLVVLPTLVFSVTFLLAYWNVMQIDYKLKLLANMSADFYNSIEDTSNISSAKTDIFVANASKLCPNGSTVTTPTVETTGTTQGQIDITVQYTTPPATYLGGKTLQSKMHTYSYNDQNASVIIVCE